MASKIQIVNMSLSHLGMNKITSLSQDDPNAIAADTFWEDALNDVYSEHRWPFANVQERLAELTDEIIGWSYVYAYPNKASMVFYVYDEGTADQKKEANEFEVVYIPSSNKRVICTNIADAYAEYTYKVTDTTLWNAKFTMAFSYKLAAMMAHTLTGDADKGISLLNIYNAVITDAKRLSHQEKIKKPFRQSSAYDAR